MDTYLDLAREFEKNGDHLGDSETNCSWSTENGSQVLGRRTLAEIPGKNH